MYRKIMKQEKRLGWSRQILEEATFFRNQLYKTNLGLRQTNKTLQVIETVALLVRMVRVQSVLGVPAEN